MSITANMWHDQSMIDMVMRFSCETVGLPFDKVVYR